MVDIENFLYIGETYDRATDSLDGAARFVIDYATMPFKLLVDIDAAIHIPILRTWAEVRIYFSRIQVVLFINVSDNPFHYLFARSPSM